jgi:hypothetical protein
MEYISLSWSDIPELVVPVMISLKEIVANMKVTEPRVPIISFVIKLRSELAFTVNVKVYVNV